MTSHLKLDLTSKAITKHINSPYAKYNSKGKLMCIVCGIEVKSAIIWRAHVNKKSHLENLTYLQEKQKKLNSLHKQPSTSNIQSTSSNKRFAEPSPHSNGKRTKHEYKPPPKPPKGILKNLSTYSSNDSDDEDVKPTINSISTDVEPATKMEIVDEKPELPINNGLPSGFFDNEAGPVKSSNASESWKREPSPEPVEPPKPNTSEVLPEGFFDDPVADAKARKVEYRDKEAEEWLSFMKEVSAAELESRQIIAEDKEEAAIESQIEEASEQLNHLQKVIDLDQKKKDALQEKSQRLDESDESSSDEEFSPVIWRTKNSFI